MHQGFQRIIILLILLQLQNWEICTTKESGTGTIFSASSVFTHTHIPLFHLYKTTVDKSWCEIQNALKAV